jgi:hypothetical protein
MKLVRSIFDYIVRSLVIVAAVFALAVVVDRITPLKRLDAYFKEYPQPYTAITLGMFALGFALLLYTWVTILIGQGRPMSEDEAKAFLSRRARPGWQVGGLRGKAAGREARMTASFSEVKNAFRTGGWLLDPRWRPVCVGLIGTLLAVTGMFSYLFVVGPPTVKVIVGGALAYALVRMAWGFWKA